MTSCAIAEELTSRYPLDDLQLTKFQQQGFIKLKNVFSSQLLDHFEPAITQCVNRKNDLAAIPMEKRDTYQKAFIQTMNLWCVDETVREFVFGKRLAMLAAELLQTSGVRLYHDQALFKESAGGYTPWHVDQQYWPLATDRTITAWVPFQAVPLEMGPLAFAAGSQNLTEGRDMEISDASETNLADTLSRSDCEHVEVPFDLGEVSFHLGWTYHRAGPNNTDSVRRVMTVIYMDENMTLKNPENSNQQRDHETWCPGALVGQLIDTPLNPVLYSRKHPL